MKLRLGLVLALVAGAVAFLLVKGLGDATVFFKNADEAVADRDDLGTKRFRLQGTVVPDSVATAGDAVEFDVEFHCDVVHVRHQGDPPELFKPGIPVVLEGHFAAPPSDVYESDKIFVRHTSEYRVEERDRLELAEQEACAG
jgi:cytochrome c-type biogenesis protein CcmE